jgi:hypothetical protein
MGTTDFADDTDEEQRQISDGGFICHSAAGRIQSNLHPLFISGISVIRGCSPFLLIEAKRREAALG